jgi:hypothetical protein
LIIERRKIMMKLNFPQLAVAISIAMAPGIGSASIFGSLGNFDVVNDTGKTARGFEIDLEGLHSADITDTFGGAGRGFPTTVERYGSPTISEYSTGSIFGVKVTYQATYNAGQWNVGTPSGVFNTPGESCWTGGGIGYGPSTPCDHFGVGTRGNATKSTYSWLVEPSPNAPSLTAVVSSIPMPTWTVTPAPVVVGQPPAPPVVVAQIQAPPPPQDVPEPQFGTPLWVKVFTTEFDSPVGLEELVANSPKVQLALGHTEMEWQLLQTDPGNPNAGKLENGGLAAVGANAESVIRRYEFYKYIGTVNSVDNQALPTLGDSMASPGEVGDFIGAQNAGINLNAAQAVVPVPAAVWLLSSGLIGLVCVARKRKAT